VTLEGRRRALLQKDNGEDKGYREKDVNEHPPHIEEVVSRRSILAEKAE